MSWTLNGRWVGKFYEFACTRCHYVLQTSEPPQAEDKLCGGCKARDAARDAASLIDVTVADRDRLASELAKAQRQIGELEDSLAAVCEERDRLLSRSA